MKKTTQEIRLYINGELVYRTAPTVKKLDEDFDTYIKYLREIFTGFLRRGWLRDNGVSLATMVEWDMAFNCFFNTMPDDRGKPHHVIATIEGKNYKINLHDSRLGITYQTTKI